MSDDLSELTDQEIQEQVAELQARMRPLEAQLKEIRAERDVIQTEIRRRQRLAHRERRADLKQLMREGSFPTVAELVEQADSGSLDDYRYNLKTGGDVRLGFPGARQQTLAFTDGRHLAQATDLARAAELYAAGWYLGSPGRPGVRVHFAGTRQEKLAAPDEVFARPPES